MKPNNPVLSDIQAYSATRNSIIQLYGTDKGRKFIHHLVYAFTAAKPEYIYYSKKVLYDCISKSELKSLSTKSDPLDCRDLNLEFKELKSKTAEDRNAAVEAFQDHIKEYLKKNPIKRLALRSPLSNKILGVEEFQALKDFVDTQVRSNNGTIKRMVNYNRFIKSKAKQYPSGSVTTLESSLDSETLKKLESLR
jgi:hypothetical protein